MLRNIGKRYRSGYAGMTPWTIHRRGPGARTAAADILRRTWKRQVEQRVAMRMMRPAVIIVMAVLIAALLTFDGYEYDGHYRTVAWDNAKQQIDKLEHELEVWLGKEDR